MKYVTLTERAMAHDQKDKIYEASSKAKQAIKELGSENVINSTLGECLDDEGNLMVLPIVEEQLQKLSPKEIFGYAPITGVAGFSKAVSEALFKDNDRDFIVEAAPTPGGCGAIRHLVWDFLDMGESLITTEYYWGPYKSICEEHGRKLETFTMFDEKGGFNLQALDETMERIGKNQKQLVLLLNTPANNPTGYTMTAEEIAEVAKLVCKYAANPERKITLCLDVSYIDYTGDFEESRKIFDELKDLPENVMLTLIFSMSKSFTMCGLRCGAIVLLTKEKEAAERFRTIMAYSSRSTWSNVIHPAQKVLVDICLDEELRKKADDQREVFSQVIAKRGKAFMEEARKADLVCCPYKNGFFTMIPSKQSDKLAKLLQEKQVYVVAQAKGIRFSPCAVTEEKCRKAPWLIKEAMDQLKEEA